MARPKISVDWENVDRLCQIQCTGEEIASVLNVSYDTLERRCKEEKEVSFADYIKQKAKGGRASLRRKQWKCAETGNATMLIWLGKQYLGQMDKPEGDAEEAPVINYTFNVSEPVNEVKITRGK